LPFSVAAFIPAGASVSNGPESASDGRILARKRRVLSS
jgi:hypothetical protein